MAPIPHFVVDLDQPAEQRWAPVCAAFKATFAEVVERNRATFDAFDAMPAFACALALRTLPRAQREDARALAAGLGAPRGVVALLQLVYEAFSLTDALHGEHAGGPLGDAGAPRGGGALGCTSLVRACADGAVVHARTLDWGWLEGLDALLVDLTFTRGGRPLYRSTTFVGFVGVLTALRCDGEAAAGRGAYSVSLNYRRPFAGRWDAAGRQSLAVPPLWRNGPAWRALAPALGATKAELVCRKLADYGLDEFRKFAGHDGAIEKWEFAAMWRKALFVRKAQLADADLDAVWKCMDGNDSGAIQLSEFQNFTAALHDWRDEHEKAQGAAR